MLAWKKSQYKGLRYRESKTEFVGVGRSKRHKRYYMMTYKWRGKTISEAFGWEGDYIRNEESAYDICRKLSSNRKDRTPPFTLAEYRQQNQMKLESARKQEEEEKARNVTFAEIFTEKYFPQVQNNRQNPRSIEREEDLFRLWINPVIGNRSIQTILPFHLERIKENMVKAGRAPRSIQYSLAVVRQVFNFAISNRLFSGANPADKTGGVKRPKFDNRRNRFLSRQEALDLLGELAKRSTDVHDMTMFSLYTGARAGEIFNLKWGDIDISQDIVMFRDTKSVKSRPAFLTDAVKAMLSKRCSVATQTNNLVFPGRAGKKIGKISNTFRRAVDKLRLNEDIIDRRDRVTFHTLRHTFASWLAIDGINPFHLKELLGHSDLKLTERYSHLSESALKIAALRIQNG